MSGSYLEHSNLQTLTLFNLGNGKLANCWYELLGQTVNDHDVVLGAEGHRAH